MEGKLNKLSKRIVRFGWITTVNSHTHLYLMVRILSFKFVAMQNKFDYRKGKIGFEWELGKRKPPAPVKDN